MASAADWGRRLSDRIRAALGAGDLATARRLALEGDGQARSLAKEYALMHRGLGFTITILLDLLGETVARHGLGAGDSRRAALGDLLFRFRRDLAGILEEALGAEALGRAAPDLRDLVGAGPGEDIDRELARTARLLGEGNSVFAGEQERLAGEIVRAIEAGLGERARALLDRKEQEQYLPLHDRFIRFMAETFGCVLERFGPEELYRFHRATAEGQRQGFEKWEGLTAAEFAQATAFLLKQHMGEVEVREDEEKFTVLQRPCGSGGRLRLAGAYAGPAALPFVEGRGALTAGQDRFPVYCSHCPVWNSVAPVEWFGRPHWVFENPSRPDGSCTLHIYKRRDGAPAHYLRLLGLAGGPG